MWWSFGVVWILGRVNIGGHWCPYEIIYDGYGGHWYPRIDGAYVFLTFVLQLRKPRKKPQSEKLTRQGIEPGPAESEATMSPLDHSGSRDDLDDTIAKWWPVKRVA